MDHFFAPSAVPEGDGAIHFGEVANGRWPIYFRDAANPGRWYVAYVLMLEDGVGAGLSCWNQDFDAYCALIADPKHGPIYVTEFRKQWKVFAQILDQTADERYGDGALAQLIDVDDLNRKWFVASLFAADPESSAFPEKAVAAAMRSVELSIAMKSEFRAPIRPLTYARVFMRGAAVGAADAQRWLKHLDWLAVALEES